MNVLYVNHTRNRSGAGLSLGALVENIQPEVRPFFLVPHGCQILEQLHAPPEKTAFTRCLPQMMTTRYNDSLPFHLYAYQFAKIPCALLELQRLIQRWRIDLIHLNETTLLSYALASRLLSVPVVVHARTTITHRTFERALLRLAYTHLPLHCVAIDEETRSSMPEPCQAHTTVIYNPIDLGAEPNEGDISRQRAAWGVPPDGILIGQVASLHSPKGIWSILDIAAELCASHPRLYFILVGDDSPDAGEGPALRRAIAERKLAGRVILPGYASNLATVYGALDVALCICGKQFQGVGRPAYEAGLARRPLVATLANPDRTTTIHNNVTALTFDPDDLGGVRDAISRLAEDPGLRTRLGEAGYTLMSKRHNPVGIARQMLELYKSILHAAPTP